MAKFKKGQIANPKGCPKGAHHIGRPKDEIREACYQLATDAAPSIIARFARMALGEDTDQVVNEDGERLQVPAPAPTQVKAGEVVLTYAIHKLAERVEVSGVDGDPLAGVPTAAIIELAKALQGGSSGDGETVS